MAKAVKSPAGARMANRRRGVAEIGVCAVAALAPLAYLGPGGAASALGTAIALVAAVLMAVVGFLWFPIKRLMRTLRSRPSGTLAPSRSAGSGDTKGPMA